MFVGYSLLHITHVYRILNLNTNYVINTRYVLWLNVTYGSWTINNKDTDLPVYELRSRSITPMDNKIIDPQMVFDDPLDSL